MFQWGSFFPDENQPMTLRFGIFGPGVHRSAQQEIIMSLSRTVSPRKLGFMALASVGLAVVSGTASAHVAVVRNSQKLQGNDYATVNPGRNGASPVRVTTQRGVGMTTRQYGGKTVITFDKPVLAAGTYFNATGNAPAQASIQAYDKSGRPLKLWDEGTRRLRVTQWTRVAPGGNTRRTFMGVRSCCACIKQVVLTRQEQPFQVAVLNKQPTPVAPQPRIASRGVSPVEYTPLPAAGLETPIAAPVALAGGGGGGGGGGFFPLILPLGGGSRRTTTNIIHDVTPVVPTLPPDTVPEPSALALVLPGLIPLALMRRRAKKRAQSAE